MSLARLVYYNAVMGGWGGFIGWIFIQLCVFLGIESAGSDLLNTSVQSGIIGASIGTVLGLVSGMANAQWKQLVKRAIPGFVVGGVGGALGGLGGQFLYSHSDLVGGLINPEFFRVIGWVIFGMGVGVADGLYERSKKRIRNGLIGGALGGFVGGLLFAPMARWLASGTGMSSFATSVVILGIAVGALIGLTQVVFRDAWLTVVDGYRTGRQVILTQPVTTLGRAEHLQLPFLGQGNQGLEAEHVRISRQADGSFVVEDNQSKLGTRLNNQPLSQPTPLRDGDILKLGGNSVRFNERRRQSGAQPMTAPAAATPTPSRVAPPPPAKKTAVPPPPNKPAAAATSPASKPEVSPPITTSTSGSSVSTPPAKVSQPTAPVTPAASAPAKAAVPPPPTPPRPSLPPPPRPKK